MGEWPVASVVAGAGFVAGIAFGAVAQATNFCTMGAISDLVLLGDGRRFRAWALAIAVAILGSQALHLAGTVDLNKSIYLTPNLGWAGAAVGGLLFGFGMTLSGGCGSRSLVRLGGGNLKSLVVFLVLGIFAYMTLRGIIGMARVQLEAATNLDLAKTAGLRNQGIADILARAAGGGVPAVRAALAASVAGGFLFYCFKDASFRASPANIAAGLVIGALIPAGWLITGVLGRDDFTPVPFASFTFVAPLGESLQYLMLFTGAKINFGIATVGGVILGAFLMAMARGEFRLEAFADAADTVRHLAGAAIMGVGGVMALGCTIGQGITGMSTLALGSVIAWLAIVAGGWFGVKYQEEGSLAGAFRALFARG